MSINKEMYRYFSDIQKEGLISQAEEIKLIEQAQKGDEYAFKKLIKAHLKFVVFVAKKFKGTGVALIDLVSEGNIGLMEAVRRFDKDKGVKFISYAVWWIRSKILEYLHKNKRIIRLPKHQYDLLMRISEAEKILFQKKRGPLRANDISDFLGLPPEKINNCLKYDFSHLSLDDLPYKSNKNGTQAKSGAAVGSADELKETVSELLSALSAQERKVVKLYFGISKNRAHNFKEISKIMGLPLHSVRCIYGYALQKMKKSVK